MSLRRREVGLAEDEVGGGLALGEAQDAEVEGVGHPDIAGLVHRDAARGDVVEAADAEVERTARRACRDRDRD